MKILIVVDMQNGFLNERNKFLVEKIEKIIPTYDKVIFTKFVNKKGSLFENKLGYKKMKTKKEQEIALNLPENCVIFEKMGYGLTQEHLNYVKSLKVCEVDVCGLETDACVYAVSLGLFDVGIFPNILINYTATKDGKTFELAKQILLRQFGKVDKKE